MEESGYFFTKSQFWRTYKESKQHLCTMTINLFSWFELVEYNHRQEFRIDMRSERCGLRTARRFSSLFAAEGRFARRNVCDSATEIPYWRRKSMALPLLLSFHQHHVFLWSQFSPGYPGLLWLHLDQVPQGLLGHMSCMSTSWFVHHYYKMDKIEQAAKKTENLIAKC